MRPDPTTSRICFSWSGRELLKPASRVYTVNKGVVVRERVRLTFLTNETSARDIDDVVKRIQEGEDRSVACLLR